MDYSPVPATPATATLDAGDGYRFTAKMSRSGQVVIKIDYDSGPVELGGPFSEAISWDVQDVLDRLDVAETLQRKAKESSR